MRIDFSYGNRLGRRIMVLRCQLKVVIQLLRLLMVMMRCVAVGLLEVRKKGVYKHADLSLVLAVITSLTINSMSIKKTIEIPFD